MVVDGASGEMDMGCSTEGSAVEVDEAGLGLKDGSRVLPWPEGSRRRRAAAWGSGRNHGGVCGMERGRDGMVVVVVLEKKIRFWFWIRSRV